MKAAKLLVIVQGAFPDGDDPELLERDGEPVELPRTVHGKLGPHPEGTKRGGLVNILEDESGAKIFWDDTACEWFDYN